MMHASLQRGPQWIDLLILPGCKTQWRANSASHQNHSCYISSTSNLARHEQRHRFKPLCTAVTDCHSKLSCMTSWSRVRLFTRLASVVETEQKCLLIDRLTEPKGQQGTVLSRLNGHIRSWWQPMSNREALRMRWANSWRASSSMGEEQFYLCTLSLMHVSSSLPEFCLCCISFSRYIWIYECIHSLYILYSVNDWKHLTVQPWIIICVYILYQTYNKADTLNYWCIVGRVQN